MTSGADLCRDWEGPRLRARHGAYVLHPVLKPVLKTVHLSSPHFALSRLLTCLVMTGAQVVIDNATDDEGWKYGTVFRHFKSERPGGRASQRLGDVVRRRLWVRRRDDGGIGVDSLTHSMHNKKFQRVHAYESNRRALREFLKLAVEVMSRERFWKTLPWDPAALYFLSKKHALEYENFLMSRRCVEIDAKLLKELLCAATHSRAAYGFAMADGHVSSVSSYIKLHTVQPLRFDVVGGVSEQANEEAIRKLTGVDEVLKSNFRNGPFKPCYYVAIDDSNGYIVVAVRGSLQVGDLLSDVNASSVKKTMLGGTGWVHEGMLSSASYIHCCIKDVLSKACAQRPGWPVLVTGHSLGGGVASVLAMMLRESADVPATAEVRCATIGSAAVMCAGLSARSLGWCTSVVLGSDPIPHLSHASLENLMTELSDASPLKQGVESIGLFWSSVMSDVFGLDRGRPDIPDAKGGETDKGPGYGGADDEIDSREMMYPAGRVAWITADGSVSFEFPFAGRLLLVESMLDDHLPDRYLDALKDA